MVQKLGVVWGSLDVQCVWSIQLGNFFTGEMRLWYSIIKWFHFIEVIPVWLWTTLELLSNTTDTVLYHFVKDDVIHIRDIPMPCYQLLKHFLAQSVRGHVYEAHSSLMLNSYKEGPRRWNWAGAWLSCCCSDDGLVERQNDVHDFWLILNATNSINWNPFPKPPQVSNVPFASSVSGTSFWHWKYV